MSMKEIIIASLIHLVMPITGIIGYLFLCRKMQRDNMPRILLVPYFTIFAVYGAALVLILTIFFWYWSGMASIGGLTLLYVAPLAMIAQSVWLWVGRKRSKYHATAFWLSIVYPGIVGFTLVVVYFGAHRVVLK